MNRNIATILFIAISNMAVCQLNIICNKANNRSVNITIYNNSNDTVFMCNNEVYYFINKNKVMLEYLKRDSCFYYLVFNAPSNKIEMDTVYYASDTNIVFSNNIPYIEYSKTDSRLKQKFKVANLYRLLTLPPKSKIVRNFRLSKSKLTRNYNITIYYWIYKRESNRCKIDSINTSIITN